LLEIRGGVCLVTGAGRGIGLATVRELLARGARGVVLVGRPGKELDAVAASLDARARVIEVNLLGVYRTLRPAIEPIVESRGHLLAISSLAATMAFPLAVAYGASKSGVDSLMRGLRAELLHTGATAGAGYFGYIDTAMMERARAEPAIEHSFSRLPAWMRRPYPPHAAARVIVDGIERRKARVWLPRMVGMNLLLRGFLHVLDDRFARRFDVAGAVRIAEAESRERHPVAS
jgi:NAD(P)-dependent dehydrogenase (short-subunit alcohol dehydrogenase family)